MFRTLRFAIPLTGVLALGGCGTIGNFTGLNPATVAAVQQAAVAACSFLPTASTVAQILAAGNPIVDTATSVASAICSAIAGNKLSGRLRATPPTVNGVVIHGRFVG